MEVKRSSARNAYHARQATARAMRAMRRARRPRYGTIASAPVQVQTVAATLAVVVDVYHFFRLPCRKFKVMRDNARALFELLFENRSHLIIGHRKKVYGKQIGGRVILL